MKEVINEVRNIAVLIDGDNANNKLIDQILTETGKYGTITIKKVYGDFTSYVISKNWSKELCNSHAIRPVHKYSYTVHKNSTDTELIIDAMDILRSRLVDGFCIVSSDSDYTGLANRIREEGMFIMGIGKKHTPEAFRNACQKFIFEEILEPVPPETKQPENQTEKTQKNNETIEPKLQSMNVSEQINLELISSLNNANISFNMQDIHNAFNMAVNESTGLAALSYFHEKLKQNDPAFDFRNFGVNTFRKFCERLKPTYTIITHEDRVTMSLKRAE
jgi:uncharacterized LabA/DUF88 family protein